MFVEKAVQVALRGEWTDMPIVNAKAMGFQLGCTTGLGNPCGLRVRVSVGAGAGQDLNNPARVMYPLARVTGFADYIAKRNVVLHSWHLTPN